jgi:hypothetical protein
MTDTKPNKCPSCGADAVTTLVTVIDGDPRVVKCNNCDLFRWMPVDVWNRLPRPSSEAGEIARDLEDLLENYHDRVNDWVAAIPQDELTPFISRLEQIADSGKCVYCGNAGGDMRDGAAQTMCDDADGCDSRVRAKSSADVPIKLTDTAGPDEHTKDLLAKLRDSQKYAMELEDRIEEMSRADVPGEVWVRVRDHEGRGKVIAVAADLAAVDKSPGPWVGPISVQGAPKETTEGEIECDSCDKRIEYEGLHERIRLADERMSKWHLRWTQMESAHCIQRDRAERYLTACKWMHLEWRRMRKRGDGYFESVLGADSFGQRMWNERNKFEAALEECHDALEKKQKELDKAIEYYSNEGRAQSQLIEMHYARINKLEALYRICCKSLGCDSNLSGDRLVDKHGSALAEIERLEKELDKQCSVFHSAMDKQADQIDKLSISDSKHRAEVVRLKEGIRAYCRDCGPSQYAALCALGGYDDTKGEGCDYVEY